MDEPSAQQLEWTPLLTSALGPADAQVVPEDERYFLELGETLAGRPAGGGATAKAEELKASGPTGIFRLLRRGQEWNWRVGAAGERRVGRELARLPRDWHVFHDIPIGTRGANVDHLVIGPGGVFSLNTKNLSGRVWVAERAFLHNGHRTDFLPRSRQEAEQVSRLIGAALGRHVAVRGVLVVMCDEFTVKAQPTDVAVVRRREIRDWVTSRPECLSPREVLEIAGKAHRPDTWMRLPYPQ